MTGEQVDADLETLRYKVLFRTAGTDRVRALDNLLDACAARDAAALQQAVLQSCVPPRSNRVQFVACVAVLDAWTNDGRRLEAPADTAPGRVRHHPYPIPVMDLSAPATGRAYGVIRSLVHVPATGDLLAVGSLADTLRGREVAAALRAGELFLEVDVDSTPDRNLTYRLADGTMAAPGAAGDAEITGMSFGRWRVGAATLGTNPCWNLPPAAVRYPGTDPDLG